MLKNYIRSAWRNLLKHKLFSLINIFGLATGIAACLVIFIYIHHELTFDKYNANANRIARITTLMHAPGPDISLATSPALLTPAVKKAFPEVETAVRIERSTQTIHVNNDYFKEENFHLTDESIFKMFSFEVVDGSLNSALAKPGSIVITSGIARKYFGSDRAIGKVMLCNDAPFMVTAVVKDRPTNSDIKIDALMSHDYSGVKEWIDGFSTYTFVLFNRPVDAKAFEKKLTSISNSFVQPELDKQGATKYHAEFLVEPLTDVHFSKGKLDDTPKGNREYNFIFSLLAVFILLIALLNYINLSTAKAVDRAKEVGIRKVSGAMQPQLVRQFLFESFFLITIAWIISFALVYFTVPFLNRLLQTTLEIQWSYVLMFTSAVFIVTTLLAGLYPAFVLSSFSPIKVLKGKFKNSGDGIVLRKVITVTQFAIAAALIMGTIVIYRQMRYIESKDLGFSQQQLLNITLPGDSTQRGAVNSFVHELRSRAYISDLTVGGGMVPAGMVIGTTFAEDTVGKREVMCNYFPIDPSFISVFNMSLVEGRNLTDSITTDQKHAFLVNEAFVKMMGWRSGLGKEIDAWNQKGKVVGVVKNFYYKSLHNVVAPLILIYRESHVKIATIRVSPAHLSSIRDIYQQHFPTVPIDYSFFDDIISKQYEKDRMTMSLLNYFTILAVVISCLGLYGLVSLLAIHRRKEIGIRKVLGASVSALLIVLSRDFVRLVFVALGIALPVSGVLMYRWLGSYAYHAQLAWWMFIVPAVIVLLVAVVVVCSQVFRVAVAKPLEGLRSE